MALTCCPDCGKEVSKAAASCPQCGRPMSMLSANAVQTQRKGGKYEAAGFLLILGGMAICFASGAAGGFLIFVGFLVFLVGRFL